MEAITVMLIPVAVVVMLMIGKCSHLVRFSFSFVSGSHSMQRVDPIPELIVPCGHVMPSQQHGVVGAFMVPGKHSNAQKTPRLGGNSSIASWTHLCELRLICV